MRPAAVVGCFSVHRIADLFYLADVLAKQPHPLGPRLGILTNAGGPGVLATDALLGAGGSVAELSTQTRGDLDQQLPAHWSHGKHCGTRIACHPPAGSVSASGEFAAQSGASANGSDAERLTVGWDIDCGAFVIEVAPLGVPCMFCPKEGKRKPGLIIVRPAIRRERTVHSHLIAGRTSFSTKR